MVVPRDCTHNLREIICERHGGSHDTSPWIQTLSENDTVPGFTFGSAVQITRLTMGTTQRCHPRVAAWRSTGGEGWKFAIHRSGELSTRGFLARNARKSVKICLKCEFIAVFEAFLRNPRVLEVSLRWILRVRQISQWQRWYN